jgi:hypothetical protein
MDDSEAILLNFFKLFVLIDWKTSYRVLIYRKKINWFLGVDSFFLSLKQTVCLMREFVLN